MIQSKICHSSDQYLFHWCNYIIYCFTVCKNDKCEMKNIEPKYVGNALEWAVSLVDSSMDKHLCDSKGLQYCAFCWDWSVISPGFLTFHHCHFLPFFSVTDGSEFALPASVSHFIIASIFGLIDLFELTDNLTPLGHLSFSQMTVIHCCMTIESFVQRTLSWSWI